MTLEGSLGDDTGAGADGAGRSRSATDAAGWRWEDVGRSEVSALLVDADAAAVRATFGEPDEGRLMTMATLRGSLDRLRQRGVRVAVLVRGGAGALAAQQGRIAAALGPVDVWCVAEPDEGAVAIAAQALGLPPRSCALVTDDARMLECGSRAGAGPVFAPRRRQAPGGRVASGEATALAEGEDRLLAEFVLRGERRIPMRAGPARTRAHR